MLINKFNKILYLFNYKNSKNFCSSISKNITQNSINHNNKHNNNIKSSSSLPGLYFKEREPKEYKKLYVENLPEDWNEDDLKWRFEQLGEVENLHIIKNTLGINTGKGNATII